MKVIRVKELEEYYLFRVKVRGYEECRKEIGENYIFWLSGVDMKVLVVMVWYGGFGGM
ncbi:hypothetical protein [Qipengyuania citrea]|uniref:hypothetical protein n=1 Tax=Qipengyuania citrea TaxID=225971 RepID=UPI00209CCDD2|nr:hypothetical protein [Qipengyuania citrea]MCP2016157.1 hypothetical protein [Qipengyuania citrea]